MVIASRSTGSRATHDGGTRGQITPNFPARIFRAPLRRPSAPRLTRRTAAASTSNEPERPESGRQGVPSTSAPENAPPFPVHELSHTAFKATLFKNPLDRQIFGLVIPALCASILDPLMSLVDTALVGQICGPQGLAGVGIAGLVWSFCAWAFGGWLSTVTTPRVAASYALGRLEEVQSQVTKASWIALVSGTLLVLSTFAFGERLLFAVAQDASVVAEAIAYLKVRALAGPALLLQFVALGTFRGLGDTRTSLVSAVIANIVNLGFDLILMLGFGWGVVGAAAATTISQFAGTIVLWVLLFRKGVVTWDAFKAVPSWAEVAPLIRAGFALSLRTIAGLVSVFSATGYVAQLGAIPLAAHEIIRQLYIISVLTYEAFSVAAQSLVARALGRGDRPLARAIVVRLVQLCLMVGVVTSAALLLSQNQAAHIFTKSPEVVECFKSAFWLMVIFLPLDSATIAIDGTLLGLQQHAFVARTTAAGAVLCLSALFFTQQLHPSLLTIWLSLKGLTIARLTLGATKLMGSDTELAKIVAAPETETELPSPSAGPGDSGNGMLLPAKASA